jgi:hypothetical protein
MTEAKEKHIHKLKRVTYKSGNSIFFCTLPDCPYKSKTELVLGKRSICWRCNEPFIMNDYSLRLAKPHCENCHKPKNIDDIKDPIKDDVIDNDMKLEPKVPELSLAAKLHQTIQDAKQKEKEEDI